MESLPRDEDKERLLSFVIESTYLRLGLGLDASLELRAKAFFLAWGGVLTIAFEGWPTPILTLKSSLDSYGPDKVLRLEKENFGSKWPKSTLAAIHDTASPLTMRSVLILTIQKTLKSF